MPVLADQQLASQFQGCIATSTRILDRVIKSIYDDAYRPLGIKSTQVALLVFIAEMRTPESAPTAADLVPAMHIDQTTLSRSLDRLIAAGLVTTDEANDARAKQIVLTPTGRKTLKKVLPVWQACQETIAQTVGVAFTKAATQAASRLSR